MSDEDTALTALERKSPPPRGEHLPKTVEGLAAAVAFEVRAVWDLPTTARDVLDYLDCESDEDPDAPAHIQNLLYFWRRDYPDLAELYYQTERGRRAAWLSRYISQVIDGGTKGEGE